MKTIIGELTVETILSAYLVTGWTPITDSWINVVNGQQCGCALTTFCKYRGRLPKQMTPQGYADHLGLTRDQVISFTHGFDGYGLEDDDRTMYDLGKQARKAVFAGIKIAN